MLVAIVTHVLLDNMVVKVQVVSSTHQIIILQQQGNQHLSPVQQIILLINQALFAVLVQQVHQAFQVDHARIVLQVILLTVQEHHVLLVP